MSAEGDGNRGMSEEAISKALEAVRASIVGAEQERAKLDRTISAAREEERLLARLLALRRGGAVSADDGTITKDQPKRRPSAARAGDVKKPAVESVIEELTAAGRPLHISELMRLLHDRKVPIPGSGTQANLITHLRRDERLIRPSRGMYGLATWGLQAMPATQRTRSRRKRIRFKASEGGSHR
jgi:hypothetical protein